MQITNVFLSLKLASVAPSITPGGFGLQPPAGVPESLRKPEAINVLKTKCLGDLETMTNHFALGIHRKQRSLSKPALCLYRVHCVRGCPNSLIPLTSIVSIFALKKEKRKKEKDKLIFFPLSVSLPIQHVPWGGHRRKSYSSLGWLNLGKLVALSMMFQFWSNG